MCVCVCVKERESEGEAELEVLVEVVVSTCMHTYAMMTHTHWTGKRSLPGNVKVQVE